MITKDLGTDIRHYKTKFLFGFSVREFFSILISVILCYMIIDFETKTLGMKELNYYFCLPCFFPVFIGFYKKQGLPIEKYLKINFRYIFLAPKVRLKKVQNIYKDFVTDPFISEKYDMEEMPEKIDTEKKKKKKSKTKKKEKNSEYIGYV